MVKNIFVFFLKVLIPLSLGLLVYYFFFLRPVITKHRDLLGVKQALIESRDELQKTKLIHTGIVSLDPSSPRYLDEKNIVVEKIEGIQPENITARNLPAKNLPQALTPLSEEIQNMEKTKKEIITEQKKYFDRYKFLEEIVDKALLYNPRQDLAVSDPSNLGERATQAVQGLKKITEDVEGNSNFEINKSLSINLSTSVSDLEKISSDSKTNNPSVLFQSIEKFINSYGVLKKEAKNYANSPLTSEAAKELLVRQTELIKKYDFWILQTSKEIEAIEVPKFFEKSGFGFLGQS